MKNPQTLILTTLCISVLQACTTYNISVPETEKKTLATLSEQAQEIEHSNKNNPRLEATTSGVVDRVLTSIDSPANTKLAESNLGSLHLTPSYASDPSVNPALPTVNSAVQTPVSVESKRFGEKYWAEFLALAVLRCIPGCFR